MSRELRLLIKTILIAQQLAGSKVSYASLHDAPESIKEVFNILGGIIYSRNNTVTLDTHPVLDELTYVALSNKLYVTLEKWVKNIELLGIPQKISLYPYTYEEFENIYDAIFFSELEALAKELERKDKTRANIFIMLSVILLGYVVGVESFAEKATFLLSIKDILKSIQSGEPIEGFSNDDVLEVLEAPTAHLVHKVLTAAGSTAQALETEDLEGKSPTRLNLLQPPAWKKRRQKMIQTVDEAALRNLLSNS